MSAGDGKVDGRGQAPAPQDRRDVHRDPHPLPRAQPAGVTLLPVGARRPVVEEVRVDVDERRYTSSSLLVVELVRIYGSLESRIASHDHLVRGLDYESQVGLPRRFFIDVRS